MFSMHQRTHQRPEELLNIPERTSPLVAVGLMYYNIKPKFQSFEW